MRGSGEPGRIRGDALQARECVDLPHDVGFVREPILLDLGAQVGGVCQRCEQDRCGAGNANDKRHYWLFPLDAHGCLKYLNKLKAQDDAFAWER